MGLGNILILTQVCAYLLAVIFSFFMFLPMSVNLGHFNGHCLLEAQGKWLEDPNKLNITSWGNSANCNFPIFVGALCFPISLFYVVWMALYLCRNNEPSWLAAFASLIVSCVATLLLLISASIITHGFSTWCQLVTDNKRSCSESQYSRNFLTDDSIETGDFYMQYEVAKFGAWTSWLCWLVLIACASVQLYRYHREEDFFVSMNRERERLVQRVSSRHAYVPV